MQSEKEKIREIMREINKYRRAGLIYPVEQCGADVFNDVVVTDTQFLQAFIEVI